MSHPVYNPGRMKERVVVQRLTETHLFGQVTLIWTTLTTIWAEVLAKGSREIWQQSQAVGDFEYLVRIRRLDSINGKDRLTWGTRTLEITGAIENTIGTTEMTELYCVEVDDAL